MRCYCQSGMGHIWANGSFIPDAICVVVNVETQPEVFRRELGLRRGATNQGLSFVHVTFSVTIKG